MVGGNFKRMVTGFTFFAILNGPMYRGDIFLVSL